MTGEPIQEYSRYKIGDLVQKKKGSQWRGQVVGLYSTPYTTFGYVVMSYFEPGSVQAWLVCTRRWSI